ncbi:hypothetical protein [Prauserella sp. PE36]|uniref:hypothetical protein n=1 Tax=Prauserella sp. PE36 TaxID=1504709 RepID=UPI0011BE7D93|nr:hypothetical protein [Prauserella sp. PE36]
MGGHRGRPTLAVGVLAVLLTASCGAAAERAAQAVADDFLHALGNPDPTAACALLAEQVRSDLESASGRSCAAALPELHLSATPVVSVRVWGTEAQVRTKADTVFLHEFASGWRITGAGCHDQGERPYDCEVGGP